MKKVLVQVAILLLSGCVSITLAQAGSGGSGSGGTGSGSGAHGGAAAAGQGSGASDNAGGGTTGNTAPTSNLPSGVQGTASQKTDASGTHPVGTPQSDQVGANAKTNRAMKGCIEKSGDDYFLVNEKGRRIQLQPGNTDLSAHVGHEVRIHGTMQSGMASMGATGENPNTTESTTSGRAGKHHMGGQRSMLVDKVDMVSENCKNAGTSGTKSPY